MKKLIISLYCLLLCGAVNAQTVGGLTPKVQQKLEAWRFTDMSIDLNGGGELPGMEYHGLSTGLGFQYYGVRLGLGTGAYFKCAPSAWGDFEMPLFAIVQLDVYQFGKFAPYIEARGGVEFYPGGWKCVPFAKFGIGLKYKNLSLGVGNQIRKYGDVKGGRDEMVLCLGYSF